jgi:hypothetical protein
MCRISTFFFFNSRHLLVWHAAKQSDLDSSRKHLDASKLGRKEGIAEWYISKRWRILRYVLVCAGSKSCTDVEMHYSLFLSDSVVRDASGGSRDT